MGLFLTIKEESEIKDIVRKFKEEEVRKSGILGATLSGFRVISFKLGRELGARVYEVVCEYRTFPPHPKDPRRQMVKVRAVTGKIIEHHEL